LLFFSAFLTTSHLRLHPARLVFACCYFTPCLSLFHTTQYKLKLIAGAMLLLTRHTGIAHIKYVSRLPPSLLPSLPPSTNTQPCKLIKNTEARINPFLSFSLFTSCSAPVSLSPSLSLSLFLARVCAGLFSLFSLPSLILSQTCWWHQRPSHPKRSLPNSTPSPSPILPPR